MPSWIFDLWGAGLPLAVLVAGWLWKREQDKQRAEPKPRAKK
jgi:hypothetical protein